MATATLDITDRTTTARAIWDEYQRTHDLTAFTGQVAVVDKGSRQVFVGPPAIELLRERVADGSTTTLAMFGVGPPVPLSPDRPPYRRVSASDAPDRADPGTGVATVAPNHLLRPGRRCSPES